ncbi:HD domain-containing protein [Halobaculum sp. MBLA0143]|uniref:HD domain-containing protein n=1 Tax=Halobaculum sp. MBLA0143 TaxID=3079933 RepID=UPI0035260BB1
MPTIKDSVHDHIEVDGVAAELLDTPPVQRLRRISQLGTVKLVYPSANHTRFEHSLGVYHLADRALASLGVEGREAERVRAAALLHDVGHAPFSHNVETLIHRRTGLYHDDVTDILTESAVGDVLRDHDIDPERVAGLVSGEGRYGQLVSGELDVDRMDYLVRDAHHTGVPYGTIDHERLIRELTFADGDLVLAEGNVQTAESLLLARALMNPTVYTQHTARISKGMLRRATERLLQATDWTAGDVRRWDDYDLLTALRRCEATAAFARRYDERSLLKRAVWAEYDDVPERVRKLDHDQIRAAEDAIADRADVSPREVIVDVERDPAMRESTSEVIVNDEVRRLEDESPLVSALRDVQHQRWRLGVYTPAETVDPVGAAAVEELELDAESAPVSEVQENLHATLDEFGAE